MRNDKLKTALEKLAFYTMFCSFMCRPWLAITLILARVLLGTLAERL